MIFMSTLYYESAIAHYGTLGMKWGLRRYQNKDGSLTPRGQKRYAKELRKISASQQNERRKLALEQTRVKEARKTEQAKLKLKQEKENLEDTRNKVSGKYDRDQKKEERRKTVSDLSNDELSALIDRATLEQRYIGLTTPAKKDKVPDWIRDVGRTAIKNMVGKAAESYGQALGKRLAGSSDDNDKKSKDKKAKD